MENMNKLRLLSCELELQASTSPSQYPFVSVVTYGGKASDRPVGGTEGLEGGPYRVMIPGALLKKKVKDLEGKKVFASQDLITHARSLDVGEFVSAWVEVSEDKEGAPILVARASGILNRNKNPELVDRIVAMARDGKMGFSYDLKDVQFALKAVSAESKEEVLELSDFKWRGATILLREAAAYEFTQLAASQLQKKQKEQDEMDEKEIGKAVADAVSPLLQKFSTDVFAPFKQTIEASISQFQTELEELKGNQTQVEAALEAAKPKPPAEGAPKPTGNKISVSDFTTQLAAAIADANKPVLAAIEKLAANANPKEPEPLSMRKTLDGNSLQLMAKYVETNPDEPESVEKYVQMLDLISEDASIPTAKKSQLLGVIGRARRKLERAQMGQGGVQ